MATGESRGLANPRHSAGPIRVQLDDILLHGQNSATLEAAHTLLRTISSKTQLSQALGTKGTLADALDASGFSGLWRSCSLYSMEEFHRECFELTEKLIEVRPLHRRSNVPTRFTNWNI